MELNDGVTLIEVERGSSSSWAHDGEVLPLLHGNFAFISASEHWASSFLGHEVKDCSNTTQRISIEFVCSTLIKLQHMLNACIEQ